MPVVTVNTLDLLEYQKKNIAKKITELIAHETKVPEEKVYVFFGGYPLDGIAAGGVLNSDVSPEILKTFITKDTEKLKQASDSYIIRILKARQGQEEIGRKAISDFVYEARNTKGCEGFDLFRSSVDIASGRLESSTFITRERWHNMNSELDFESSNGYNAFSKIKDCFFENDSKTLKRISQNSGDERPDIEGKILVSIMIEAQDQYKEMLKKEITEKGLCLKLMAGCLHCEVYQGMERTNDSNTFLIEQVWEDADSLYDSGINNGIGIISNNDMLLKPIEIKVFNMLSTPVKNLSENAVLGDTELMSGLKKLNSDFGELCINASGVPWGKPLIDQKTKIFIAIAVDVVEQITGKPFENHVQMALKQGITREELEELLLFMTIYAGFNKAGIFYPELQRIFGPKIDK